MNSDIDIGSVLPEIVSETFEGMAFLEVWPSTESIPGLEDLQWLWARVGVHTPVCGVITVALPGDLAQKVTRQMYGVIEEKDLKRTVLDAMGEIANTIAGKLVGKVVPEKKVMNLGLPETGKGFPDYASPLTHVFCTDEGMPVIIAADLEEN